MKMDKIKAILIDFDGTLIDSLPLLYQTYLHWMTQFSLEGSKEEFALLNGPTIREVMRTLNERYHLNQDVDLLTKEYEEQLVKNYVKKAALMPGVVDFLNFAKNHYLRLAIVTAAKREIVEATLNAHGILNQFDLLITGEVLKKGKPDPSGYLLSLQTLNISPEEALAIEDSFNGVSAALTAGIPTVMFCNKFHLPSSHVPLMLACDWSEIRALFSNPKDTE